MVRATWRAGVVAGPAADEAWEGLTARYREPHRTYHTLRHIAAVVTDVELLIAEEPAVADATAVRLAALYHDAVYDPRRADNEVASAVLARRSLHPLGVGRPTLDRVEALIMATAGYTGPHHHGGDDRDTDVLVDADLAVLGSEPAEYDAYVRGVRAEYGHLDDFTWRRGRASVLRAFLDRLVLYRTETMQRTHEHRARANMQAELAAIEGIG